VSVHRLDESLNLRLLLSRLFPRRFPAPEIDYDRVRVTPSGRSIYLLDEAR
jgi:hypothetical protein